MERAFLAVASALLWLLLITEAFVHISNQQQRRVPASSSIRRRWMANEEDSVGTVESKQYDLAIIGAGVVGVQAALAASQSPFGKTVVLIDAPRASGMLMNEQTGEDLSLGGPTGLFSKALRDTSKRISVSALLGMGLREDSVWNEIINNCVDLASFNSQDIMRQLKQANVHFLQGMATFPDDFSAECSCLNVQKDDGTTELVRAGKILIATGSKPFRPEGIPFDGRRIFDSDSINTLSFLPRSLAITGSGIIAIEFAKIMRNLGAEVTLIIRDSVPKNALMKIGLDKDVAATLVADIIRSGIVIKRGAQVKSFERMGQKKTDEEDLTNRTPFKLTLEARGGGDLPSGYGSTEILCDAYLAAVGRVPNTGELNLQAAGIQVDGYGGILVDSKLCTTAKSGNVYAAGDVVGRPFLASTGTAQGKAAISSMFNQVTSDVLDCPADDPTCSSDGIGQAGEGFDPASLASNPFAFPIGVWSSPEAAYYGLTLEQAKERGIDAGEAIALYAECLRGLVFSPNGLLKLVFEKPAGRIIGVHICGDDACELIHFGMECIKGRRTIMDLQTSLFSAVTYHEMYHIAASAALDEAGARKRRAAAGVAVAKRNRKLLAKDK
ncbi:soluble pyridine nucleotide transhydrogenase [Nitzschia inconspicua]|uniref:Soluble pyridine nucleotide transhydrogenase n=1 Tax=Nitzschia inconspicua TaxID=303405 RepID=A0A9K3PAR7_9STRA|nr:soluble pyridine nucleotide transhydrogenase [Nitzschia inconspicua]